MDVKNFHKKLIQRQLIHGCRYCSVYNTNELHLLVSICFWVKEGIDGRTNQVEKHCKRGRTRVFVSSSEELQHTDEWIASFYIALFKTRNYGYYVHVHAQFMYR